MLVPQFNESSHFNMLKRLRYFQHVALCMSPEIDVVIIDDGSTDDSLDGLRAFVAEEECGFYVAAIHPNTNKVGALYLTALELQHEYIIFSDFDTDLFGYENIPHELSKLTQDDDFLGGYFRMLPHEGQGNVFLFQQIEYSLARGLYKFHHQDNSVPVMPGAGSVYKRDILIAILEQHSGLRSGEDRESTLIGLKMGYKVKYINNVMILTRPPLTLKALIKQRVRWNLGYIETFAKEKEYYFEQAKALTRLGQRSMYDFSIVVFLMLFPAVASYSLFFGAKLLAGVFAATYLVYLAWCIALIILVPTESNEFKKRRNLSVLLYPVFKFIVDYISWVGALIQFYKKNKAKNAYYKKFVLKQLSKKKAEPMEEKLPEPLLYSKIA